jgi:signal transduction histidine kinase
LENKRREHLNLIKQQEEELIQKIKFASLGEISGGMAHEINNPLTILSLNNKMMKKIINNPELDKDKLLLLVERNKKTINRMNNIIKGLQFFSASNNSPNILDDILVIDLINESLEYLKIQLESSNTKISLDIPNELLQLKGNRVQLSQVLVNIIRNALDECPKEIIVKIEEIKEKIIISIIDNGLKGIDPTQLKNIFNPFYTTKEIGKGTGLGLSISKGIIEFHNGTLQVSSHAGKTEFKITLPA